MLWDCKQSGRPLALEFKRSLQLSEAQKYLVCCLVRMISLSKYKESSEVQCVVFGVYRKLRMCLFLIHDIHEMKICMEHELLMRTWTVVQQLCSTLAQPAPLSACAGLLAARPRYFWISGGGGEWGDKAAALNTGGQLNCLAGTAVIYPFFPRKQIQASSDNLYIIFVNYFSKLIECY